MTDVAPGGQNSSERTQSGRQARPGKKALVLRRVAHCSVQGGIGFQTCLPAQPYGFVSVAHEEGEVRL